MFIRSDTNGRAKCHFFLMHMNIWKQSVKFNIQMQIQCIWTPNIEGFKQLYMDSVIMLGNFKYVCLFLSSNLNLVMII